MPDRWRLIPLLPWLGIMAAASAGPADVIDASAACDRQRICRFDVTVRHDDTGWDHYADRWDILTPAGDIIATRVLYHPHVDEQPFTRSLGDVRIPAGVRWVRVRAHDSVHGAVGAELQVEVP